MEKVRNVIEKEDKTLDIRDIAKLNTSMEKETAVLTGMKSWTTKRFTGYVYFCLGVTDVDALVKITKAKEHTVQVWIGDYRIAYKMLLEDRVKHLTGNVTDEDVKRWNETKDSINEVMDNLNDEIKMEKKVFTKIERWLDKLENEDLNTAETKQALQILNYFKDRDVVRSKKVKLLLDLKKVFEDDSGLEMEKILRNNRRKEAETILIKREIDKYIAKVERGEPVTNSEYHEGLTRGAKNAKKFLEVGQIDKDEEI